MDDASDLVRGKQGTSVTLEYIRGDDTFEVTIKRKAIDYKYVSYDKLNDSTGYIKITSFEQSAVDDFKEALDSLGEIDNLVLDLRDNGGGDIELAKELMNIFLPDGTIATLESTDKELNGTKYTLDAGNELKYNIVVLVNENTASASEIMTSYIQENKYGVVVGQTTYGKGIYQCLMEFVDGSAMKLTLGKYYTSNGTCINGEGIEPDYKMDFTYDVYLDEIPLDDDKYVQKALELLED
jgi:carboxyl-terminal processing protease